LVFLAPFISKKNFLLSAILEGKKKKGLSLKILNKEKKSKLLIFLLIIFRTLVLKVYACQKSKDLEEM